MKSIIKTALPYIQLARLDKLTGFWLLLLPCWWGLLIAKPLHLPLRELSLFSCGALFLRGAGCTYNDIVDRKYDRLVQRTASRPLAIGSLPLNYAIIFLISQLLGGLIILMQLPNSTIRMGFGSLILLALYPWMKRITYWPQAFLGLTFNWGILMGWLALKPTFHLSTFILYGAGICWTLGYDTIYALQDTADDLKIGVKSSALFLGDKVNLFLKKIYGSMIFLLFLAGFLEKLSLFYYLGLLIVMGHLVWQILTLDKNNPDNCLIKFKSNVFTGFLISLSLYIG